MIDEASAKIKRLYCGRCGRYLMAITVFIGYQIKEHKFILAEERTFSRQVT